MYIFRADKCALWFILQTIFIHAAAFAGYDPVKFFTQKGLDIIQENGQTKAFPGGHDEKYWAKDAQGNLYKLRIRDPLPIYTEVGGSLLSEAAGLPTLPIYPVLIKRGQNGVPTSDVAQTLGNPAYYGKAGARGEWFAASAQPIGTQFKDVAPGMKLTASQVSEWVGQMTLNYILDNQDVIGNSGNISISGGHLVTPDVTQSFRFYPQGSDNISSYLEQIPTAHFSVLSGADSHELLKQINGYLSRLEKLSSADLEKLFGAYFDATASFRKFKNMPDFDYRAELKRRITTARPALIRYLNAKHPKIATASLGKPLMVEQPVIHFPSTRLKMGQLPSAASETPENLLWSYFFQDFWKLRAEAETRWGEELGVKAEQVLPALFEKARERHEVYYVAPGLTVDYLKPENSDQPQTHLNSKNQATVFVVPENDDEAREISRIAKKSDAHVIALDVPHGSKLTKEMAANIIEKAKELKATTVAVVELPGLTPDVEADFEKQGLRFIPVDHHEYRDLSRRNPMSSLEQSASILGYDLGSTSKVIEVQDRGFIYGLRDLGVSKDVVTQLYPQRIPVEALEKLPKFKSAKWGDFYIVPGFGGKIGEIAGALAVKDWPAKVNVLIIGEDLRFSGNPKFREVLTQNFSKYEQRVGAHYHGGDPIRSEFWGIKGIPKEILESLNGKALNIVQTELDADDAAKFREVLATKAKIPAHIFDSPDALAIPVAEKIVEPPKALEAVPSEDLEKIMSVADPKERVGAISKIHWSQLDDAGKMQLLEHAAKLDNSFEIGQYIRLANESGDSRWKNVLQQWVSTWETPTQKWQTFLRNDALKALAPLQDGCVTQVLKAVVR